MSLPVKPKPTKPRFIDKLFEGIDRGVFSFSAIVIVGFVLFGGLMPKLAGVVFSAAKGFVITYFKWFYIDTVTILLGLCLWLIFSKYGNIKLGHDDDEPEFSLFAWFSMLFSAGMGIGLLFYSIAEPIFHMQDNPFLTGLSGEEARQIAMRLTFFHWGFHPWAVYALVGMVFAFFAFRKDLPLALRSALYPIIGDRIHGPLGVMVDVIAVFGTVFGMATTLGLGAKQLNTGLTDIFGISGDISVTLIIIAVITVIATLTTVSGVGKGIKICGQINIVLSVVLLLFILAFGPTQHLINAYSQNVGDYLDNIIGLSFFTDSYGDGDWQADWTAFYWGWWLAWAPFVGMFIARISLGRTIREFLMGVLFVPTLLAFVWLTVFGNTGLFLEHQTPGILSDAISQDVTLALYRTIELLDGSIMGTCAAFVATVLISTYFITSANSSTLVVSMLVSGGNLVPPRSQRIIWGLTLGGVAAVLLVSGGLQALQAAAIMVALPFAVLCFFLAYGLVKALREETAPLAKALAQEVPTRLPELVRASLPDSLENIVGDALKKHNARIVQNAVYKVLTERPDKYENADMVKDALERVLAQHPESPVNKWNEDQLKDAIVQVLTDEDNNLLEEAVSETLGASYDELKNMYDPDLLRKAIDRAVSKHPETSVKSWTPEVLKKTIVDILADEDNNLLEEAVSETLGASYDELKNMYDPRLLRKAIDKAISRYPETSIKSWTPDVLKKTIVEILADTDSTLLEDAVNETLAAEDNSLLEDAVAETLSDEEST